MTFRGARRGQSIVLGAIFVFAIAIFALGLAQTFVVPTQNGDTEFKHYQDSQRELMDLNADIRRASSTGEDQAGTIDLGVQYPSRALLLNPAEPAGNLRTVGTTDSSVEIRIENARATDAETRDYWNPSTARTFSTGSIEFKPNYNEFREGGTMIVENSVFYTKFEDAGEDRTRTGQNLVDGRRINLVALDGDYQKSTSEAVTVEPRALSSSSNRILVEEESTSEKLRINVPTKLSEERWLDLLRDELDENGPTSATSCDSGLSESNWDSDNERHIVDCEYNSGPAGFNELVIVMEPDVAYRMKLSKVGLGTDSTSSGAHYITSVEGDESSLVDVEKRELVVEVRDRFNNPVSGEEVPLKASNGEFARNNDDELTAKTDENGQISVTYLPDDVPDGGSRDDTVTAGGSLDLDGNSGPDFDPDGSGMAEAREEVTFEFTVVDSEADTDVGGSVNPSGPILLSDTRTSGEITGGGGSIQCQDSDSECYASLTFDHNNPGGTDWKITDLRYHFYMAPGSPGSPTRESPPASVDVDEIPSCDSGTYDFQDNYKDASQFGTISAGGSKSFRLDFDRSGGNFQTIQGDGFFVTLKFESVDNPSNTFSATYFAAPVKDTSLDNPC